MKIAMMVRGYIPVPRPADMIYAPIDLAIQLAQGLTKKGHDVDFYAPLGSRIPGVKVVSDSLRPLIENESQYKDLISNIEMMNHYFPAMWEGFLVKKMFEGGRLGKYDVLHFHHPETALQMANTYKDVPVLYTLHDPVYDWYEEMFGLYASPNQYFASISDNQRRDAPDLQYIRTVHNGINLRDYPFSNKSEDYLLYAGRIVPEKGVKEAIQVAKQTNHRLLIIGPVYKDKGGYFEQYIKPFLDDQILYLGYMDQKQLPTYYQKAKALLTPVQWEEPFGLTTIEAMASGTPVISFRRGAAPEIIASGKTGSVVDTTAEMIDAVHKIKKINRKDCRDHVKNNFTNTKMVNGYENAFEMILAEKRMISTRYVSKRLRRVPKLIRDASQKQRLQKIIKTRKLPVKPKPR
jgi:glycosyltransferase involved in cell wall biosynthesis